MMSNGAEKGLKKFVREIFWGAQKGSEMSQKKAARMGLVDRLICGLVQNAAK